MNASTETRQGTLSPVMRWLADLLRFLRYTLRRFADDDGMETAGLLSYTTLLSLVPLLSLVLAAVSAFPVFQQWSAQIQDFVFRNFVPAAGEVVQQNLSQFVQKASELTMAGVLFLLITALVLMSNIEKHFNRIFRVQRNRSIQSRLLVYWSTLTLGPMLLGASFALSSYLFSLPFIHDTAEGLVGVSRLLRMAPVLVAASAFTLMYIVVPNRRVRWRNAIAGGVLAALLLELAKSGFVLYVSHFPTYNKIYGAVAAIPIFLLWMYLSWAVILFGANFTAALAEPRFSWQQRQRPRPDLVTRMQMLHILWQAFLRGESPDYMQWLKHTGLSPQAFDRHLDWLLRQGLVARLDNGRWTLKTDLDHFSLGELMRRNGQDLLLSETEADDPPWLRQLLEAMKQNGQQPQQALQQPLARWFSTGGAGP